MIAAMAAAVSTASTLRLLSEGTGASGRLALADGGRLLGVGTDAAACAAGLLVGTGFAKPGGELMTPTGTRLTGVGWRPTE